MITDPLFGGDHLNAVREKIIKKGYVMMNTNSKYIEMSDLELVQLFKKEYDRIKPNSCYEFYCKSESAPSRYLIEKRLNLKWNDILYYIGVEATNIKLKRRTRTEYIHILQNLNKVLGHSPSVKEFIESGHSQDPIVRHFGSYNKALMAAGLKYRKTHVVVTESKEELLAQYKKLCQQLGRPASCVDIINTVWMYSPEVYSIRFGGMRGLKIAAGFAPHYIDNRHYTKHKITKLLKDEIDKLGRTLTVHEINKNPNLPSYGTILKNFKTTSIYEVWDELKTA